MKKNPEKKTRRGKNPGKKHEGEKSGQNQRKTSVCSNLHEIYCSQKIVCSLVFTEKMKLVRESCVVVCNQWW